MGLDLDRGSPKDSKNTPNLFLTMTIHRKRVFRICYWVDHAQFFVFYGHQNFETSSGPNFFTIVLYVLFLPPPDRPKSIRKIFVYVKRKIQSSSKANLWGQNNWNYRELGLAEILISDRTLMLSVGIIWNSTLDGSASNAFDSKKYLDSLLKRLHYMW